VVKPTDPKGLVTALVTATFVGYAGMNALPFLLGSLMDHLALDEGAAGLLGSFELGALAVASAIAAPQMARRSRRGAAFLGAAVATLGHLVSGVVESYSFLVGARLVAGIGEGVVLAAAGAVAAGSTDPDRLFARTFLWGGLAIAVFLAVLPYATVPWGYAGGFALVAAVSLVCMPLLTWMGARPAQDDGRVVPPLPHVGLGVSALAGVILFALGQGALWAFTERIGQSIGLTPEAVGIALGATQLAALSGAAFAWWLGTRRGRAGPLVIGVGGSALSTWALVHTGSTVGFWVILLLWGIAYFFALPYLLGTAAALDRHGRWSAAAMGLSMAGVALGPGSAGFVISLWGYTALGWLVVVSGAAAIALMLPAALALGRTEPAPMMTG
jgi:predicted MFS family arabinose efflux permease